MIKDYGFYFCQAINHGNDYESTLSIFKPLKKVLMLNSNIFD